MNFASQCVWAGLNGNNYGTSTSGPIAWKNLPMDYTPGAADSSVIYWYDNSSSWQSCSAFLSYINANINNTTDTTVKAITDYIGSNEDFSGISDSLSQLVGSVLLFQNNGAPYHAVIVNSARGTARGDVYFCGNSPMRQNYRVSFGANSYDSIRIIIPQYLQIAIEDDNCKREGHFYPMAETDPTKRSTQCSKCGYYDLRLIASMLKPQDVGTTTTIFARTNYECYRISVNITHTDGTSIWEEAYNTSSISFPYTFAKKVCIPSMSMDVI